MNVVTEIGRITKDLELKQAQNGKSFINFNLAVERTFKNANGEKETDFFNVFAWGKTAEIINDYAFKGARIGITGSLQTRNYENNQGQKVYITEINAQAVQLLESKNRNENQNNSSILNDDDLPF